LSIYPASGGTTNNEYRIGKFATKAFRIMANEKQVLSPGRIYFVSSYYKTGRRTSFDHFFLFFYRGFTDNTFLSPW
jgi:hypothetical protein